MIEIVAYRPAWPAEFEQLAADLRSALGPLALRVDHIGSTAVPGLCAKDVIDVQIAVRSLDEAVAAALSAAGFVPHGPARRDHVPPGSAEAPDEWAKLLFRNRAGARRAHIHVRRAGASNHRFALLFRDFLRADAPTAQAYGELKRRLAVSLADAASYPEVKDPAVDLIHLAAERWARATGWSTSSADR